MTSVLPAASAPVIYIASAVAFIIGLKLMARARAVGRGSAFLAVGFVLALGGTLCEPIEIEPGLALVGVAIGLLGGWWIGNRGRVGLGLGLGPWLSGAGGAAAALVAVAAFLDREGGPAAGRLALTGGPRGAVLGLAVVTGAAALLLGLRAAIGQSARGHGQSAVVALAASTSGLASALVGFAFGHPIVVTVGGLVAAAGYGLAAMVGAGLGRPALDVALGTARRSTGVDDYREVQSCGAEEAAMVLETARKVIVVPGRGMAVAQAQHALAEVVKLLAQRGAEVRCAIHPAAGLIPGHMNILLDEAKLPRERLLEWQAGNAMLADADVALVVGANDIVNPGARDDRGSAAYGMPFLDVGQARVVFVIKRSLRPGAMGVRNPLFERSNVNLVFGDAKQVLQAIGVELKAQMKAAA